LRFGLVLSLFFGARAWAEDRVTVHPEWASKPITEIGEIVEFNGQRITIRVKSGNPIRTYAADEVRHVDTYHGSAHKQGLELFEAEDAAAAERAFDLALGEEPRGWVQEELRAWLVRCAQRRGDRTAAARQFVKILERDPQSRHWGVAPLVWAAEETPEPLRGEARGWLAARNDGVRLLAASLLLLDSAAGPGARGALDELSRSLDQTVQGLARAQGWRLKLIESQPTPFALATWRAQVERMPPRLRGGPMYLLGRAAALSGNSEQAATDWLWLPLVYTDNEPLAARACLDAAEALARLGRQAEAQTLYLEVAERFDWSPFAEEARQKLTAGQAQTPAPGPT
jgi:TolA-binding protein